MSELQDLDNLCHRLAGEASQVVTNHTWGRVHSGELASLCHKVLAATGAAEVPSVLAELGAWWQLLSVSRAKTAALPYHDGNEQEAAAALQTARRLLAASSVALVVRSFPQVPSAGDHLLNWSWRAAVPDAGGPPATLVFPEGVTEAERLVRECFCRVAAAAPADSQAGAARNVVLFFLGIPAPAQRRLKVPVLFQGRDRSGFVAHLHLEYQEGGVGECFEAIEAARVQLRFDLREAIRDAWHYVCAAEPDEVRTGDVRWWWEDVPGGAVLEGASLQAAAAAGLTLLLQDRPYDVSFVLSATVDAQGRLGVVAGITDPAAAKLNAALRLAPPSGEVTLIVSPDNLPAPALLQDWKRRRLEIIACQRLDETLELVSGEVSRLLDYFQHLTSALDDSAQLPGYLAQRPVRDLYVEPDILKPEDHPGTDAAPAFLLDGNPDGPERRVCWTAECAALADAEMGRRVVLGSPGGGKTLLLRMTAHRLAETALSALKDQGQPLGGVPLPILVPLPLLERNLAAAEGRPKKALGLTLVQLLRDWGLGNEPRRRLARYLVRHAADRRTWLLLDGLDEVARPGNLHPFFRTVQHWPARLVITCRTHGFDPQLLPFEAVACRLARGRRTRSSDSSAVGSPPPRPRSRPACSICSLPAPKDRMLRPSFTSSSTIARWHRSATIRFYLRSSVP